MRPELYLYARQRSRHTSSTHPYYAADYNSRRTARAHGAWRRTSGTRAPRGPPGASESEQSEAQSSPPPRPRAHTGGARAEGQGAQALTAVSFVSLAGFALRRARGEDTMQEKFTFRPLRFGLKYLDFFERGCGMSGAADLGGDFPPANIWARVAWAQMWAQASLLQAATPAELPPCVVTVGKQWLLVRGPPALRN